MALLGKAAIAMWWDIAPAHRTEFEDWHSHEHFPERLRIPGFLRGSRWSGTSRTEGSFVMYELDVYETLTSAHYLERLNNPTPWSTKMMPHHQGMVRSQCRVMESFGGGLGGWMMTVRLSPAPGQADAMHGALKKILAAIPDQPGLTSGHLLKTETPKAAQTKEQKIRGTDAAADWIVLVHGYDGSALEELRAGPLAAVSVGTNTQHDIFRLAYALTPGER